MCPIMRLHWNFNAQNNHIFEHIKRARRMVHDHAAVVAWFGCGLWRWRDHVGNFLLDLRQSWTIVRSSARIALSVRSFSTSIFAWRGGTLHFFICSATSATEGPPLTDCGRLTPCGPSMGPRAPTRWLSRVVVWSLLPRRPCIRQNKSGGGSDPAARWRRQIAPAAAEGRWRSWRCRMR